MMVHHVKSLHIESKEDHITESTIMTFKLLTLIFVTTTCTAAVSAQSDTCRACNCQFNNVQVLDQLIEDKVTRANGTSESKSHKNLPNSISFIV